MASKLPQAVRALVKERAGFVDAAQRGSRTQLEETCRASGYVLHPSVASFEATYGGLVIPDSPGQAEDDPVWLFGAHACLASKAHVAPRGGKKQKQLVPVVYSPNDVIYFLDADGRAWAQDTIEESSATPFADDGDALVLKLLQELRSFDAPEAEAEAAPYAQQKTLRFASEKRDSLPDIFDQLTLLTELDASMNRLQAVPDSLWRAPSLRILDLSHNPLTSLSAAVGNAKSLRSLGLRSCELATLPPELAQLKNLEALYLTGCAKLEVDAALRVIAHLPKLKDLALPLSRSLTTLAPLAGTKLKALRLAGNGVDLPPRLPDGIGQLLKLKDLRIEYADDVAEPRAAEDVRALRLLFHPRFGAADMRKAAQGKPHVRYLAAFIRTLPP